MSLGDSGASVSVKDTALGPVLTLSWLFVSVDCRAQPVIDALVKAGLVRADNSARMDKLEAEIAEVGVILGAQLCDTNAERAREVMALIRSMLTQIRHLGIHADGE